MTDFIPAFRAELQTVLDILDAEIGGLINILPASLSSTAAAILAEQLAARQRRRDLIANLLPVLAVLCGDGYPASLPQPLGDEIKKANASSKAAVDIFIKQDAVTP